jgi:hypothetical protein
MPARDRVTDPAQILRQIHFHLRCRFIRHRVEVIAQFRQAAEAVALDKQWPAATTGRGQNEALTLKAPRTSVGKVAKQVGARPAQVLQPTARIPGPFAGTGEVASPRRWRSH